MHRLKLLLVTAGLAALPNAAGAQNAGFADHAAIDAQVSAFTGARIGMPGGARQPVDRRLRLSDCPQQLTIGWQGRGAEMVRVECSSASGWRIFVPVNAAAAPVAAAAAQQPTATVVERGQVLTITIQGRGFAVSQQGEALEDGAIGDWVRVRPEGVRDPVRARIQTPGRAIIPLS